MKEKIVPRKPDTEGSNGGPEGTEMSQAERNLRDQLPHMTPENIDSMFPIQPLEIECEIQHFYNTYGIK